jgi:hypothetical protein
LAKQLAILAQIAAIYIGAKKAQNIVFQEHHQNFV